jgi:DNA polymerase-3 subunit beta
VRAIRIDENRTMACFPWDHAAMGYGSAADARLLTISTFARAVGVPASALRHYAARDVLVPVEVDPVSGYRYYAPAQIDRGVLVREMRAAEIPIPVMREVLQGDAEQARERVVALRREHTIGAGRRHGEFDVVLAHLAADAGQVPGTAAASVTVPGPVLASTLGQVVAATVGAEEDVDGVVWSVGAGELVLTSTDRYWLAQRRIAGRAGEPAGPAGPATGPVGGTVRAIMAPADARNVATLCAHEPAVRVTCSEDRLLLARPDGHRLLASAGVERAAVPDLDRLVATQPAARVVAGMPRADLLTFLNGTGNVPVVLVLGDGRARWRSAVVGAEGPDAGIVPGAPEGWASEGPRVEVTLQPALLTSAARICPGDEVLFSVVDAHTPLVVGTAVQDTLTCLVMPMRL